MTDADASASTTAGADNLSEASTVTVVVHGIGEHSRTAILDELERGLSSLGLSDVVASRQAIPELPLATGERGTAEALRIATPRGTHLVVPMVWSDVRVRISEALDSHGKYRPFSTVFLMQWPALIWLWGDVIRCIPKAAGVWLKLAVSVVGLFIVSVPTAVVAFGAVTVIWKTQKAVQDFGWFMAVKQVVFYFLLGGPLLWLRHFLPKFDLVSDVALYVGHASLREHMERWVCALVRTIMNRAPGAKVLLVGHSLGGVIVAHSLLRLSASTDIPRQRIVLVTLGAPFALLSRVFTNMYSAQALHAELLARSRVIAFWANLWRAEDRIGRSLLPIPDTEGLGDVCVGPGGHANYWKDIRVWKHLVLLAQAVVSSSFRIEELGALRGDQAVSQRSERPDG